MKNILCLVALVTLVLLETINSCAVYPGSCLESLEVYVMLEKQETTDEKLRALERWVLENVSHVEDISKHNREYWQTPDETYRDRTGDCEDHVGLFMYFAYKYVGVQCQAQWVKNNYKAHMMAKYDNKKYFSVDGNGWLIYKTYTYNTYMDALERHIDW